MIEAPERPRQSQPVMLPPKATGLEVPKRLKNTNSFGSKSCKIMVSDDLSKVYVILVWILSATSSCMDLPKGPDKFVLS